MAQGGPAGRRRCIVAAALLLAGPPLFAPAAPDPSTQPAATVKALRRETTELATRVLQAFPKDPSAYVLRGSVCFYQGETAEAEKAWKKALELDPFRADAYHGLASVAWETGEFEKAVKAFGKRDFARAETHLKALLESHADQPDLVERSRSYLAMCARAKGAKPARPKTFEELLNYGVVQHNRGEFEEVPEHVRRGFEIHFVKRFEDVVPLLFRNSTKAKA